MDPNPLQLGASYHGNGLEEGLSLGAPLGVAWAVGLAWLLLFALRRRIGWSPLAAAVVGLHAWSITHLAQVAPAPGLTVGAGWLVLTGWPLIVLLVHVREGTHRARQLAAAVLVGTVAVTAAAATLVPDPLELVIRGLSRGLLAFLAAVTAVVGWEILARQRIPVPLRLMGAVLLSLSVDATAQGSFEALITRQPFEQPVLGYLSMAVLAASMHGALGALWLLVLEGERWTSTTAGDRSLLQALSVMLGVQRYDPMRPHVVREPASGLYHRTFVEDHHRDRSREVLGALQLDRGDREDEGGRRDPRVPR